MLRQKNLNLKPKKTQLDIKFELKKLHINKNPKSKTAVIIKIDPIKIQIIVIYKFNN